MKDAITILRQDEVLAEANADLQSLHCENVARMSKTCSVLEHKERETYKKKIFQDAAESLCITREMGLAA